jgi:hypothetical protein
VNSLNTFFPISTTRLSTATLLLLTACSGGGEGGSGCISEPPDSLYVWCNGAPGGLYYEKANTLGPCVSGDCLDEVPRFSVCLGPELYNETGDTGSGDIDLDTWTNDTTDIDFIRSVCVAECKNRDAVGNGECEQDPDSGVYWQVENYEGLVVPDPGNQIDDPWHLGCWSPQASLAPLPWQTTVIPFGTSPAWPSNPTQGFALNCGDFEICAKEFVPPILGYLSYDDTVDLWGPNLGNADYLATTSGTSATSITITINNPTGPSSATNVADGRIEYSTSNCGALECPFYLANLTLANTADTWQVYSHDLDAKIYITDITLQMRRPTLGVWNTSTNEIYLGEKRIDIYVTGTVQVGTETPMEGAFLVTNLDAIYGEIGSAGDIQVLNLIADDGGSIALEVDLDLDTLSGSPPIADHGLRTIVSAPSGAGLPISSLTDDSWDPDSDIVSKFWIVDGVERQTSYVIPPGTHTIGLGVMDERGALDIDEDVVMVQYP